MLSAYGPTTQLKWQLEGGRSRHICPKVINLAIPLQGIALLAPRPPFYKLHKGAVEHLPNLNFLRIKAQLFDNITRIAPFHDVAHIAAALRVNE